MAKQLIPDPVWELLEPHFPPRPPKLKGGRPVVCDRDVLTGILFVLKTGIAWDDLPLEMGCGCGVTCLRRLREWHQAGTWQRIAHVLQRSLRQAGRIDWFRAEADARNSAKRRRRIPMMAAFETGSSLMFRSDSIESVELTSEEQSPASGS